MYIYGAARSDNSWARIYVLLGVTTHIDTLRKAATCHEDSPVVVAGCSVKRKPEFFSCLYPLKTQ